MSNSQKGKEGPKGVHSLGAGSLKHTIWQKQRNKISPAAHNLFLYSKNIKFCCLILKKNIKFYFLILKKIKRYSASNQL